MLIRISPAIKGLITVLLMIAGFLAIYYANLPPGSVYQYVVYAIYGLGVVWTLVAYRLSATFTGRFADLFVQGFKCFIVVTLVMVIFTFAWARIHPELATESAKAYKEQLLKENDALPTNKKRMIADIEKEAAQGEKNYNTILVYGAIFGYLIIGAGVTAISSLLLMRRS